MQTNRDVNLAECTFFGTGGKADTFITIESSIEINQVLRTAVKPLWFLGSGANVLISDQGLRGTTIHLATSDITLDQNLVIADAGAKWDDLVQQSINSGFWGLERMSGIPGSVGAAVVGNIAAYGQAVADTLAWVEVIDTSTQPLQTKKLLVNDLSLSYRFSAFQTDEYKSFLIIRVAFNLQTTPKPLEYKSALKIADELNLDPDDLVQRRDIILEARRRIGSLIEGPVTSKTAGSFFRNPTVSEEQAELLARFDEHNVSPGDVKKQNLVHGGSTKRVSAAHVLLGAGFKRGQSWGAVRLHPDHILKIENTGEATSQEIYDVSQEIIKTVKDRLGIDLVPEVRFLGDFA